MEDALLFYESCAERAKKILRANHIVCYLCAVRSIPLAATPTFPFSPFLLYEQRVFFQLRLDEAEDFLNQAFSKAIATALRQLSRQPAVTPSGERLLRISEVCSLLRISRPTCRQWTKTGRLAGYKQGRRVLYKESEVMAALKQIL